VIGEWAAETKEEICLRKGRFPTIWEVVENYLGFVASGWWRLRRSDVCGRSGVNAFSCLESRVRYRFPSDLMKKRHLINFVNIYNETKESQGVGS
jgi:hypothetical protein